MDSLFTVKVRGVRFHTSLATLQNSRWFKEWMVRNPDNKLVELDGDADSFRRVLNYMRYLDDRVLRIGEDESLLTTLGLGAGGEDEWVYVPPDLCTVNVGGTTMRVGRSKLLSMPYFEAHFRFNDASRVEKTSDESVVCLDMDAQVFTTLLKKIDNPCFRLSDDVLAAAEFLGINTDTPHCRPKQDDEYASSDEENDALPLTPSTFPRDATESFGFKSGVIVQLVAVGVANEKGVEKSVVVDYVCIRPNLPLRWNTVNTFAMRGPFDAHETLWLQLELAPLVKPGVRWAYMLAYRALEYVEIRLGWNAAIRCSGEFLLIHQIIAGLRESESVRGNEFAHQEVTVRERLSRKNNVITVPLAGMIAQTLPVGAMQFTLDCNVCCKLRDLSDCVVHHEEGQDTNIGGDVVSMNLLSKVHHYSNAKRNQLERGGRTLHPFVQVQEKHQSIEGKAGDTLSVSLYFDLCVKYIAWVFHDDEDVAKGAFFKFAVKKGTRAPMERASLHLNGACRFDLDANTLQNIIAPSFLGHALLAGSGIFMYPFVTTRDELMHQKSLESLNGLNFSRVEDAALKITLARDFKGKVHVYALNENVLVNQHGLAGLKYIT